MSFPRVHILDLTSIVGSIALRKLGVDSIEGQFGYWRNVTPSPSMHVCPFNWERPGDEFPKVPEKPCSGIVVLVGPGSLNRLGQAAALSASIECPICFMVMPNAILEEINLRSTAQNWGADVQVLKVPSSDPQALWLILLEHIAKLSPVAHNDTESNRYDRETDMTSNLSQSMKAVMTIDGALAAALVDLKSGMCLAKAGEGMNLDLAAAGNTEVVRAKLKTIESLGLRKGIEDILITLMDQYHLIRLVPNNPGLFLYLVLDKSKGNLALARYKLMDIEQQLKI